MKFFSKLFFLTFVCSLSFAQDTTKINISFYSAENIFTPPNASFTESRIGLIKDFQSSNIRLDIGASPDIFEFGFHNKNIFDKIAVGADFHAFGLLFNESDKIILQVDAIDAFFGGHISFKDIFNQKKLSARFRIMHLSSHLVDGHYDIQNNRWKNGKYPNPFGREFLEFHVQYSFNTATLHFGANYIFRQRPNVLTKTNIEFAADYQTRDLFNNFMNFYAGYDFKLNGIQDIYFGNNTIEAGVRFGTKRGMKVFALFYSGKNYYGEYYSESLNYIGAGFNIIP
jgi:hypothetical protein